MSNAQHIGEQIHIVVRSLYELPRTAHTRLLCNITNLPHVKHNLKCRFIKFVNNVTKSCNKKVKFLARMFLSKRLSVTGCITVVIYQIFYVTTKSVLLI